MKRYVYALCSVLMINVIYSRSWSSQSIYSRLPEKPIVVVVPSFNNKEWYEKNLDSIFNQHYSNFRVIYIDDCSDDGTDQLVQDYIDSHGYHSQCTFIRNNERYGPLYNRFKAIHTCNDQEIVVLVDGDDSLAHPDVLSYLNEIYTTQDIYLTVGNACKSSTGIKIGYRDYTSEEWNLGGIRTLGFRGVHPRTFYAWLFKKIKVEDLFEGEKFYPMATDVACLLPMMEMAQGHYKYITDILYIYNDENTLNMARNGLHTQLYCDLMIRNKQPYQKLSLHETPLLYSTNQTFSAITFVTDNQTDYPLAHCCKDKQFSFDALLAVAPSSYNITSLDPLSSQVKIVPVGCELSSIYSLRINIKDRIKHFIDSIESDYVAIVNSNFLKISEIDFETIAQSLKNTQAYGMVITSMAEHNVPYIYEEDDIHKSVMIRPWQLSSTITSALNCMGIIMHKKLLISMIENMTVCYPHFTTFLAAWHSMVPSHSVLLVNFLK